MTADTRFFFDECLSRPVVESDLAQSLHLFGSPAEIAHLITKFEPKAKDLDWVPKLAEEGGWIVITTDQGKKSTKSKKLPLICRAYGVTHVMLSAALHRRNMYYKALAIETHWERLHLIGDEPCGAGHRISMHGSNFRMAKITEAPDESEIIRSDEVPRQQDLFGQ